MAPKLAIVIPMYNESSGAEACIVATREELQKLDMAVDLIVVNDGSNDGTAEILDELCRAHSDLVVIHQPNGGYGRALVAGAREAARRNNDYVVFMDSDLTNPPSHVQRFVPLIQSGFDLIKACRFCPGGSMSEVPWRRAIFSHAGNIIAQALFRLPIRDCTNGFRAIRTSLFLRMPLRESGFAIIVEELYWAKVFGARIGQIPTTLRVRSVDQRRSLFSYSIDTLLRYLRYAVLASFARAHNR